MAMVLASSPKAPKAADNPGDVIIVYSQRCQMALAGGAFDGHHYFRRGKPTGIE